MKIFLILLLLLFSLKVTLVCYRVLIGQWPLSVRYLIKIIQWDKEAAKIGLLALLALFLNWLFSSPFFRR
jgi:hypothetical protein